MFENNIPEIPESDDEAFQMIEEQLFEDAKKLEKRGEKNVKQGSRKSK